jgi:hypothetical protein
LVVGHGLHKCLEGGTAALLAARLLVAEDVGLGDVDAVGLAPLPARADLSSMECGTGC